MQSMRTNIISFFDDGGRDLYTIGNFSIQDYTHMYLEFLLQKFPKENKSYSFDEHVEC